MDFRPFRALRFDDPTSDDQDGVLDLSTVICNRADRNEKPADGRTFDVRRLLHDSELMDQWHRQRTLVLDNEPALYLYRLGYTDATGVPAQCSAVWGQLTDSLDAGLVPSFLPPAPSGFGELLHPAGLPVARATDQWGYHHRLWKLTQGGVIRTIADAVAPTEMAPSEALGLVSESDFSTPTHTGRRLGDVVAIGLVMVAPSTVQS